MCFSHRRSSKNSDHYSSPSLRGWTGPFRTGEHAGGHFLCNQLSIFDNSFAKPLQGGVGRNLPFLFLDKTDDESPRPSSFVSETQPFADGTLDGKVQPSLVLHILPETYSMYGDLTIRFGRLCKAKVYLDQVTAMASGEAYVWQQGPSMPGTPRDMITA